MARAQGFQAWGPVTDPDALAGILSEAMEAVKQGGCALVNVHVTPGYVAAG